MAELNPAAAATADTDAIEKLLQSDPDENSFECLGLALTPHEPSVVRKSFLKLSLKVHPDKNSHPQANEAFQILSAAFELLYDKQSQQTHLSEILEAQLNEKQKQQSSPYDTKNKSSSATKKRPRPKEHWKEARKKKRQAQQHQTPWAQRKWEDVVKELKRREQLEQQFIRSKSDQRMERRIQGMIWRAMKICRSLDERAGAPPTFVNGLWAPLYEQEVSQLYGKSSLPSGWEQYWDNSAELGRRIYRNVETREEQEAHPKPSVEQMFEKARKALASNKFSFHTQPRLFLGEIVEYLREDHEYHDMDDDLLELEQEEKAREAEANAGQSSNEYDF